MDTPTLDDLPPAMPGHGSSTFRGARASLNPRFSPVRTTLQSGTSHEHVQHSRQEQCAVCDNRATTDTALQHRTPRTHATLQLHQTRLQRDMQCSKLRNDKPHDPHARGGFAPPGPRFIFTGLRASAAPAQGGKARFVGPPVWSCGSYIPNPEILADLNVGHAAREAWRRDLSKQRGRSRREQGNASFRGRL